VLSLSTPRLTGGNSLAGHSGSSHPLAALPPAQRPSARCDETGSAVSHTNVRRAHDVTGSQHATGGYGQTITFFNDGRAV
jgi:hypothetical protein